MRKHRPVRPDVLAAMQKCIAENDILYFHDFVDYCHDHGKKQWWNYLWSNPYYTYEVSRFLKNRWPEDMKERIALSEWWRESPGYISGPVWSHIGREWPGTLRDGLTFAEWVHDNPECVKALIKFVEQCFPETLDTWATVVDWFMGHDFDDYMDACSG